MSETASLKRKIADLEQELRLSKNNKNVFTLKIKQLPQVSNNKNNYSIEFLNKMPVADVIERLQSVITQLKNDSINTK